MIDETTLERVEALRGLDRAARAEILAGGVLRRWETGEPLWEAGAPARGVFWLLDGSIRVVREDGNRQWLVHTVEDVGASFGEVPLFTRGGYPARAVAAAPTECLVLPEECVRRAMAADAELSRILLGRLAARVRKLVRSLGRLARASVRERLLARLAADIEIEGDRLVVHYGSHAELADTIGTAREVVSREIGRLRDAGTVRSRGRGTLEILDAAALGAPDPYGR